MEPGPPETCRYCGAGIDPAFYFCTACATPYVNEEAVLPARTRLVPTDAMRIRERVPQVYRLFWTYLAVVLGGVLLLDFVAAPASLALRIIVLDALLLVTTVGFVGAYWRALVPQLRRVGFGHWEAWAGLAALPVLLFVNQAYSGWISGLTGIRAESPVALLMDEGLSRGAVFFLFCVFPAITEEIAFRGLVQHWLHVVVRPATAIVLAAALFTALHFDVLGAPYLFVVGVLLGWLRWRTGSLWPSIAVHFAHNAGVLAILRR